MQLAISLTNHSPEIKPQTDDSFTRSTSRTLAKESDPERYSFVNDYDYDYHYDYDNDNNDNDNNDNDNDNDNDDNNNDNDCSFFSLFTIHHSP
ncbi:MAG TPA: hypothetical protein VKY57_10390, partial [Chitinispirillaceae bacterium]|nr:hypothetical protein [Chitinispirillaceae bacterium]